MESNNLHYGIYLSIISLIAFAFINWTTGLFRDGGFYSEVGTAMIQSMVAIFITVPATLLTGAGTILGWYRECAPRMGELDFGGNPIQMYEPEELVDLQINFSHDLKT